MRISKRLSHRGTLFGSHLFSRCFGLSFSRCRWLSVYQDYGCAWRSGFIRWTHRG